MQPSARNAFEVLCLWASQHRWCWKIPCTTCGNQQFRIGLSLIARGIALDAWDHRIHEWPDGLLPAQRARWAVLPESYSRRLTRVSCRASLRAIRDDYIAHRRRGEIGEDWLGYLGVALERGGLLPEHKDQVATVWRKQLDGIVGLRDTRAKPVTFAELEIYEKRLTLETS